MHRTVPCLMFLLALSSFVLAGCGASSRLRSAYGNKYRYGISMISPVTSDAMLYRDERMIIQFRFDDPAIRFQAQNISPGVMQIDWSRVYLEIGGKRSAVRNLLTYFDTTATSSTSGPIQSLEAVRDVIVPAENILIKEKKWHAEDLIPTTDGNEVEREKLIRSMKGQRIQLVFPVSFNSVPETYRFTFSIDSVTRMLWSDYRPPAWFPRPPPVAGLKPTTEDKITTVVIVGGFAGFLRYFVTMKKTPVIE